MRLVRFFSGITARWGARGGELSQRGAWARGVRIRLLFDVRRFFSLQTSGAREGRCRMAGLIEAIGAGAGTVARLVPLREGANP